MPRQTRKTIGIFFADYLVGSIPYSEKDRLYNMLLGREIPSDSCIKQLNLEYEEEIGFNAEKKLTYQLGHLHTGCFWSKKPFPILPCHQIGNYYSYDARDLTHICARHMEAGECKDEFMRRTFGAVLFPKLYGKDKQK